MNINLLFETILILFAILASNGIIYSLTFFNLNKPNSSENISIIRNSSGKDGLALTSLIASSPIGITSSESSGSETLSVTSSESSGSETLSVTSSESSGSETLSVTSSETNVSQDSQSWIDLDWERNEGIHADNSYLLSRSNNDVLWPFNEDDVIDNITSRDSITILDTQTFEQWREIAMDLHDHPVNSPAAVLQQIKFEELNILYSQDIIHYAITQTELRLIIEHLPATSLFNADVNHLILTIMSFYHFF
jgi:hypothetical protein